MGRLRPHEASALKSLGKEAQPIPTPPQDLPPVPRLTPEDKQLPREGIFGELGLHECRESIEPFAHVSRAGREPHLNARRQCNHRRRVFSTRFRSNASTVPCSRTRIPPANSISMTPRRSEEHTSELQSQSNLVCRLLLEKKKKN